MARAAITKTDPEQSLNERFKKLFSRFKLALILIPIVVGVAAWLLSFQKEAPAWRITSEIGQLIALVFSVHLFDHLFIRREDRVLILEDLKNTIDTALTPIKTELRKMASNLSAIDSGMRPLDQLLRDTRSAVQDSRAAVYRERKDLYAAIVQAIRRVDAEEGGEKSLWLLGMHGGAGNRRSDLVETDATLDAFDTEMRRLHKSADWYIREIYNIADLDRLNKIVSRIADAENAIGYEVKAYCIRDPLPTFRPLAIGSKDVFLGLDDPTYYRARSGIHLCGAEHSQLAIKHFEGLWNDSRLYALRTAMGVNSAEVDRLRQTIAALTAAAAPATGRG